MSQAAVDTPAAMADGIGSLPLGLAAVATVVIAVIPRKTESQMSPTPTHPQSPTMKGRWWLEWLKLVFCVYCFGFWLSEISEAASDDSPVDRPFVLWAMSCTAGLFVSVYGVVIVAISMVKKKWPNQPAPANVG